jgi:tRNA/rRNA methyltransferase
MNLSQIVIVLCNPDESRNIGSVCRAMLNMGVHRLRIVGNPDNYNIEQVKTLSIHAFSVWENAEFYPTLQEAVADCITAAGTTRRRGKKRKSWLVLPEEFVDKISDCNEGNIAIVFGNERTGLTDEELELCTIGVTIPSSEEFGSLNLSHAVQLLCYTLYRGTTKHSSGYTPISIKRLDKTVLTISNSLEKIGFFKIAGKSDMEQFWKGVLSRAVLSESEASYIEKTFTKAAGLSSKIKTNISGTDD